MTHPSQITADSAEYLDWCARAKAGEVTILSVVVGPGARYRLSLLWPATPKPVQTDLFG